MRNLAAFAIATSIVFSASSVQACSMNNRHALIGLRINFEQCMAIASRAINSVAVDNVRQEDSSFYASGGVRLPITITCVRVGDLSAVRVTTEALNQEVGFIEAVQQRMKSFYDGYGVDDR
jgi:hypothetical protein